MEQAIVTIQANGQTTQVAIPLEQVATVVRYVNKAANPESFTVQERRAHVLELCAREEGATTHEVAIKYDTGEQGKYNSIFVALRNEGLIARDGSSRKTASGHPAKVHFLVK